MGGWGSGRPGWRPVVEDGLALDFGFLRRLGGSAGTLWWSRGGDRIASIGWRLDLAAEGLTLNYTVDAGRRPVEQYIHLITTRPHFGGIRYWMICPVTRKRCAKLYSYPGHNYFTSREALGLAYRSQREDRMDRALRRGQKVLVDLGGTGDMDEAHYLRKPKWMRWPTFERKIAKVQAADDAWNAAFCVKAGTLLGWDL